MGKLQKTCIFKRPFLTEKQIKFRLQSASARLTQSIDPYMVNLIFQMRRWLIQWVWYFQKTIAWNWHEIGRPIIGT